MICTAEATVTLLYWKPEWSNFLLPVYYAVLVIRLLNEFCSTEKKKKETNNEGKFTISFKMRVKSKQVKELTVCTVS